MSKKDQITFVMVTHEPSLAACADRIITILDGRVQSDVLQPEAVREENRAALARELAQIETEESAEKSARETARAARKAIEQQTGSAANA